MKQRTLIGLTLILSSFILTAAGAFIIDKALDEENRLAVQKSATERQCERNLKTIPGAVVDKNRDDNVITVSVAPVVQPEESLTSVSMSVMMCPLLDLTEMCMGDKCDPNKPGVVSLVYKLTPIKE